MTARPSRGGNRRVTPKGTGARPVPTSATGDGRAPDGFRRDVGPARAPRPAPPPAPRVRSPRTGNR